MRPEVVRAKHTSDSPGEPPGTRSDIEHRTETPSASMARHRRPPSFRFAMLATCLGIAAVAVSVAVLSCGGPASQNAGTRSGSAASPAARPSVITADGAGTTRRHVTAGTPAKSVWHHLARERRIRRWKAGPGGTALAAVQTQMGTAMQAAGMKLYANMRLACMSLASNVRTAQAGPPIPDSATQRLYTAALVRLSQVAAQCRAAISAPGGHEGGTTHVRASLLKRVRAQFAAAAQKLNVATGGLAPV